MTQFGARGLMNAIFKHAFLVSGYKRT